MEQYMIDAIIVVIMVIAVVVGARRGLIRALIAVAALIASLFGAAWCANNLTPVVVDYVQPLLTEEITTALQTTQSADASGLIAVVVDVVGRENWDAARQAIEAVGWDNAKELLGEVGRNAATAMVEEMLTPIVHTAVFILTFILLRLVLKLASLPLNLVDHLPVIHGVSHLGGAVIGAVSGAIIVSVGLWGCETFAWLAPELVRGSKLAPYFAEGAWIEYFTGLFS